MGAFEPKQFGKYYLIDKLAVGGMAEIYKAKTFGVDGFEKELAIKRILPHCSADKDFITMLIDEAKLSVVLSHANIVQVYDLGKVGDDYFISMEFIHGVNLRDMLYHCREQKTPIPTDIAVYIISEICKGLDYAHRKTGPNNQPLNIVHRDISPQNVLISHEGEVKIVDFGIAKAAMNISHTMAGILKGKIAYMSPEQAMGKTIDNRTDIFSAGILLYEVITGARLFTGESQFEVLKKIRTTKVSAQSLSDLIPQTLKPVVAKALAYNVDERYQNAGDLQIDLTRFLYSTYSDFSPRKLSSFIREVFKGMISGEEMLKARESALEQQTSSMDIEEGAKQLDIVHRDITQPRTEATRRARPPGEASIETVIKTGGRPPTKKAIHETPTEKHLIGRAGRRIFTTIAALGLIAAAVYALQYYVPQVRFWERLPRPPIQPVPPQDTGTLNVITDPPGAAIMIEGKLTGLTTPAVMENLTLNKDLRITLSKPDFEDFEQVINLSDPTPQKISTKLKPVTPQSAKLVITSTPPGASVLLNGKDTGRTTPATIANLEPMKYMVTLAMKDHDTWSGTFDLQAQQSLPVDATLAKTVVEPQPPKPPEVVGGKGSLRVTSKPEGASISLDGRATGLKTPATLGDLKIGSTYNIRLELGGYKGVGRKKSIMKESDTLFAELSKIEERPPPETPTPPPPPETKPPPPPQVPPETTEEKGGTGTIRLASNPSGADVFINAEHRGRTPLTVSVPAGKTTVVVSKEGLAKFTRQITVKPGQAVNLTNISLGDLYGEVSLTSDPPRAQVIFDGQSIPALTPVTVRRVRRDQSHSVTIQMEGYKSWSRTFTMDEGNKSFHVTLQPK